MTTGSEQADDPSDPTLFSKLLNDYGVSDTQFARRVNGRARQQSGVDLGLARTTVGHWRRGMRPRDPMVAQLAADEVSVLVGYPIAPADLDWKGRQLDTDDLGLAVASTPRQTMETVAGLSGRDMRRRDLLQEGGGLFAAAAFADPVLASLTGVVELIQRDDAVAQTPTAAMTRQMTATFRQLDAKYGSATIRPQVVAFLHDRTKLAASARPDADVFGALSELTQFAAWLSQDCGKHGTAQRYFVQALALAEHAGDRPHAGRVLAAMSDQSGRLGHQRSSLALARAAVDRAVRHSPPAAQALMFEVLATANARAGNQAGVTDALVKLERAVDLAGDGDGPAWAAHFNVADVAECHGQCYRILGNPKAATSRLLEARRLQTPERARTRTYAETGLALAYLHGGDLDAALEAGRRALDLAKGVTSTRTSELLGELDATFATYDQSAGAREWRTAAATAAALPAGRVHRERARPA